MTGGTAVLVVAAGRGHRFGGELPKQYALLGGLPVLAHCLRTFSAHPKVSQVCVAIHPDDRGFYDQAAEGLDLLPPAHGGASRQESVFLGLQGLQAQQPKQVLIHDGARPFVDTDTIDRVLQGLQSSAGAIAALPVVDSLKREDQGQIAGAVERSGLWRAQTPQGFRFDEILAAHARAQGQELTDDAAVAEAAGLSVALVEGGPANIKITSQEDLMAAERWLAGGAGGDVRVGQGFDVHRFGPGDQVMLGGIAIPHHSGLVGHSDADVALHALTDALLGAVGAGDIGQHFPPSDPQWRGAPSDLFLKHAADLVRSKGGRINHLDLTVICEAPKVGRHRAAMAARIAEILGIDIGRVNVKATTTEKLGFTGREEGIAAQASATVALASR